MKQNIFTLKKWGAYFVSLTLLLSVSACQSNPAVETVTEAPKTIHVETQTPQTGQLAQATEYIGRVEPDSMVKVKPKMGGTAARVLVGVGDAVKKGDLLMTFDTTDLEVQLEAQRAAIEVSRAAVMTTQAQVDQSLGSQFDLNLANLETSVQQAKNSYSSARQGLRDYDDDNDTTASENYEKRNEMRDQVKLLNDQIDSAKTRLTQLDLSIPADAAEKVILEDKIERLTGQVNEAESTLSMLNANVNEDDVDVQMRELRTNVRNAQLAYDSANTIYEVNYSQVSRHKKV